MRKGYIALIIIGTIILFGIGVFAGIYVYKQEKVNDSNKLSRQLALQETIQNENKAQNELVSTSKTDIKISPNCTIVEKQYFKGCDHITKNIKDIDEEWINYTEEQIKEQYSNWNIESFSHNQVIVSQENEGFCNEHYVIKENGDVIAIYTINEAGEENWKEDTEISTIYLPDEDLAKIQEGIKVIGDDQLHSVLGDFE